MLSKILADEIYVLMKEPPAPSIWQRFTDKIEGRKWQECWIWTAARRNEKQGYGQFQFNKRPQPPHRLICDWLYGKLPFCLKVDHLVCSEKACCNPLHLIPTSQKINTTREATTLAGRNIRKEFCPRGHLLKGNNLETWAKKNGKRSCKKCANEKTKRWRENLPSEKRYEYEEKHRQRERERYHLKKAARELAQNAIAQGCN